MLLLNKHKYSFHRHKDRGAKLPQVIVQIKKNVNSRTKK